MAEILSWGGGLGTNVFFTELGAMDSFCSKKMKSGCGIFAQSDVRKVEVLKLQLNYSLFSFS